MEDLSHYRGNSHNSKPAAPKAKPKLGPVISRPPTRQRVSVWSKFRSLFVGEDARDVGVYVMLDVVAPRIKDLVFDMITEGTSRSLYGSPSQGRGYSRGAVPTRHTNYNRPSPVNRRDPEPEPSRLDRQSRATHDFTSLRFANAMEAETIVDRLNNLIGQYGVASVNDFYDAIGLTGDFTDDAYGWSDLTGVRIRRVRDGYILELPRTHQIDNN